MDAGLTIPRASGLTVGIPERYLPTLRAAQLATFADGRYWSTRYLVTTRILERLHALGYAEELQVDALFVPHYRYVAEPMAPLHSRDTSHTGGTHCVNVPIEVAAWVDRYRDEYGLPGRSRAAVQLLSLDEVDDDRGRWDLSRITARLPLALAPHVSEWQTQSRKHGRTVALSSIILSQLCAAMSDIGVEYKLPRDYRIRWRTTASDVERLVEDGKLQASIPRILRESLTRARATLYARNEVSASEWHGETIVRLLWLRVGKGLPDELRNASPGESRTVVNRVPRAVAPQVGPDVYAARFLTLCKERAARDAWHARGGTGRVPPSTVDDHLGRKVFGPDAYRIAADRGLTSTDGARSRSSTKRSTGTGSHLTW